MASTNNIDTLMAELDIEDEENEELQFDGDVEEESNKFDLCLVGRFLTEKNINIRAMKSKLADIWRPSMGINIKDLQAGLFLFQFYHKEDMQWVQNGGPWSFDNAMLVLNTIASGEDPLKVPLFEVNFWIQLYDLPVGFMSETVGKQLGNFFGTFIFYDPNNNTSIWRECMRVRIKVDVRKPLKRKKKISRKNGTECIVQCKYERLGDFCFICGMLTHTERFCRKKLDSSLGEPSKDWGSWLRAPPRRGSGQGKSKWLREDGDDDWGNRKGKDNYYQQFSGEQSTNIVKVGDHGRDSSMAGKDVANFTGFSNQLAGNLISKEKAATFNNSLTGPDEEELIGLQVEDRKRRRNGPYENESMITDGGILQHTDSVLSNADCSESSVPDLATLAQQASQAP